MKARPILFSGPMVQALLTGRKSQTRRVVKQQPPANVTHVGYLMRSDNHPMTPHWQAHWMAGPEDIDGAEFVGDFFACPYGEPGDLLYVRETWQQVYDTDGRGKEYSAIQPSGPRVPNLERIIYRATDDRDDPAGPLFPWRPAIHMPRYASRLTLRITGIRIERLQAISEADAIAEGIEHNAALDPVGPCKWRVYTQPHTGTDRPEYSYETLWESINGTGSWAANPWCWAIGFEVIQENVDQVEAQAAMSFNDTTEAHERRITRCNSCRARIIWLKTDAGKNMPTDADSVEPEDQTFEPGRHISHFSSCPNADKHRRPR